MNNSRVVNQIFKARSILFELIKKISIDYSRHRARIKTKKVVKLNGGAVVDRSLKNRIKDYSLKTFGNKSYWPYLVLYTEIRGEFLEGWIPYDYYRYNMLPGFNPTRYSYLSKIKTYDYRIFGDFAVKPLFLHISDIFYNIDLEVISKDRLKQKMNEYNDLIVVKGEFSMGGSNVKIVHSKDFDLDIVNDLGNHVIQPYIKQYKVLNDLYPESVNTFKITTYRDLEGNISVKYVILRFGIDGAKVDNLSAGGQYVYFDINGNPSEYAYHVNNYKTGSQHKNTGFKYSNIKIPMYNKMLEKCIEAHQKYPYLAIIGWDVCIDVDGVPRLIEWNGASPSFWEYESVFGPFWTMDEINDMREVLN